MFDTIMEMVVALDRLEKRLVEGKTPVETAKERVLLPPPPLPLAQFPHIPSPPLMVGM